ncbi:hypothetical protein PHJA_001852000 [Phtheirospermum japonicum]|uniref:Uncharacterized protein n=1 Tax=Phtheirospermum japonicum TaxID=374723 RepID=A0A830CDB4_9LAMI|nr:hypothetical protein PHJA_001852000 [Phtheirospermum japonicum]
MARKWAIMLVVLVCCVELMQQTEGQSSIGQCMITCSQTAISCATDCGISRGGSGALSCYQGCGASDIACLVSCIGTQVLPQPKCG